MDIGQRVVYGMHGVCVVTAVEQQKSGDKKVDYLILEPVHQSGSRFMVPTHNPAAMSKVQKLLTREELEQLLQSDEIHNDCWIADEGKRKQTYRELISAGDRIRLMSMVYTLYRHKTQQTAAGRKVHLCDENFLRDAEKLLSGEISFVMNMEPNEAKQYLRTCLKE